MITVATKVGFIGCEFDGKLPSAAICDLYQLKLEDRGARQYLATTPVTL